MSSQSPKHNDDAPPTQFAETTPTAVQHEFAYLEMVVEIHKSMAHVTEKMNALSESSRKHDEELARIGREVYAAKVVVSVVGTLLVALGTIAAFVIKNAIDLYMRR